MIMLDIPFIEGAGGFPCLSIRSPLELIKILGDWKSDAVFMYLTVPLNVRLDTIKLISSSLSQ